MSFDDTAREPDQIFSLNHDVLGELEYPTKYVMTYSVFIQSVWYLSPKFKNMSFGL